MPGHFQNFSFQEVGGGAGETTHAMMSIPDAQSVTPVNTMSIRTDKILILNFLHFVILQDLSRLRCQLVVFSDF